MAASAIKIDVLTSELKSLVLVEQEEQEEAAVLVAAAATVVQTQQISAVATSLVLPSELTHRVTLATTD